MTATDRTQQREAARQRAFDRMLRSCDQLIATGIRKTARAELLHRTRQTTKEHVHADR